MATWIFLRNIPFFFDHTSTGSRVLEVSAVGLSTTNLGGWKKYFRTFERNDISRLTAVLSTVNTAIYLLPGILCQAVYIHVLVLL